MLDTLAGHPLLRRRACWARSSCWASPTPDTRSIVFGAILLYTAFHFIVFALIGMGLVALVHWGIENSVVRYALLPIFLVFEVLFYGLLEVLSERTNELFPFWAVVTRQHARSRQHGLIPLDPTSGVPALDPGDARSGAAPLALSRSP